MVTVGFFALMNVITGTYVETVSRQAADLKTRTQKLWLFGKVGLSVEVMMRDESLVQ